MSQLVTSYSKGTYRAGEQAISIVSRLYRPDATVRGCMAFHGAGNTAIWIYDPTLYDKPNAIAAAGIPFCAFDFGDPASASGTTSYVSWGNDNAITAAGAAKTFLQATETTGQLGAGPGAKTDKFFIYAGSMGALVALNYLISLAAPADVCAAVALVIPILDLDDVYQNDKGSFRASIGAAYGVSHPTAIPNLATHSPAAYSGANLTKLSMPIKIWTASDDPIAATTSVATAWAATVSNATVVDLGAVGHVGTTVPAADVAAFLAANAS